MNPNPKLTGKHFLVAGAIGVVALIGYKIVQDRKAEAERFQQQMTIESKMPTAEESIRWAIWDAKTKYYTFDIVSTNVNELAEKQTYHGTKQGGAAEDAEDRQEFGAAYDAYSAGDSFTRTETNYVCDLIITHTKPKPESEISKLFIAEMTGDVDTNHLEAQIRIQLMDYDYDDCKILNEEVYQVNRNVFGELMKPVNGPSGIAYVWDTEERDKIHVEPTWVLIEEVANLKPKN